MEVILIAVAVLVVVAIVVVLLMSKDKPAGPPESGKPAAEAGPKETQTNKRFKQVLASQDEELDQEQKQKADELLTKYTAGTGEGIAEVERLLVSDPNNVDLLDWLAFMYYSNNNIDKAIDTYKKALAIKPTNENQHYYLGNSYFKKGMYQDAVREWNEVIRLKPNSKIAKNAQERIEFAASNKSGG